MSQRFDHRNRKYIFRRSGALVAASCRKGVRAADFWEAMQSIEEMTDQRVQIDKPSIMITSAEIISECRASARDMALTEILFAVAREKGMGEREHEVKASLLMKLLQIDSVDRLIDALVRIVRTIVLFDFKLEGTKRSSRARPLLIFDLDYNDETELKTALREQIKADSAVLKFQIYDEIRALYVAPKPYTWLSLAAISQFKCMYTNAFYQLLASEAHKADYIKPLPQTASERMAGTVKPTIFEIDAQRLAEKIGWSLAKKKDFNVSLFIERVINPCLVDLVAHEDLIGFDVDLLPMKRVIEKGKLKAGRKLAPLQFKITRSKPVDDGKQERTRRKNDRLTKAVVDHITRPDHRHPESLFPSLKTFTLACRERRLALSHEDRHEYKSVFYSPKRRSTPSEYARSVDNAWRVALDRAFDDPECVICHDGFGQPLIMGYELLQAGDDPRFTAMKIDEIFVRFMKSADFIGMNTQTRVVPPAPVKLPDEQLLKPFAYELINRFYVLASKKDFDQRVSSMDFDNLRSFYSNAPYMDALIAAAETKGVDLANLPQAFRLLLGAHPVRLINFTKAFASAALVNDFEKIKRTIKAVFAKKAVLDIHPRTGEKMATLPKIRFKPVDC